MRVVVIGAGLGGLAAACHLVGRGHDVLVVERDPEVGGRAGELRTGGYRFDTGPTVVTMPDIVASTFAAAGAAMADHVTIGPLDPMYRATFADGSILHVRHGREAMAEEIRSFAGAAEAEGFHRFWDWATTLYELERPHFIDTNIDSPLALAWPPGPLLRLLRLGGFRRLSQAVGDHFADERLQRVFSFQAMYAGLAPYQALALYAVITYMDAVAGVCTVAGGVHQLAVGLAAAATAAGAEVRCSTPVTRILRAAGTDGRVLGVELANGERIAADAVVANPDLPVAYRTLLPGLEAPRAARKGRYSPSCVVWHVGSRGAAPPGAAHHNLHFGHDWDGAFRAVMREGTRMPDPSILVTVPTVDDPSAAPPGRTTLYVLEPVPNLAGRLDWTTERGRMRDDLARRVEALGYPVTAADLEVEELVDPLDWERQGMERGTPFALAHTFFQTGPFRPGNVDRRAPGLVFVGSGTVPGVGIPMVLLSGRLAAERVDQLRPTARGGRR